MTRNLKKLLSRPKNILLICIVLLGLFLRLYKIHENFYFTMDEEVMNLIQRRIILGQHFPLIGSVSAIGTYLGPIFYYFGSIFLFLSRLNPLGMGIFASIFGALNIVLIYKVSKDLFSKKVGQVCALFYATSLLMVLFDRRFWHLGPGPILSLLILWSLYKIKKGFIKYIYLLTAVLIFGWNTDYTNLILFLFTAVSWIVFKLPIKRREVLIAVIIFLISNTPVLFFDMRHDFLNAKIFISYFTHHSKPKTDAEREILGLTREDQAIQTATLPLITFSRLIYTNSDLNISQQHTYCKPYILSRNRSQGLFLPLMAALIILLFFYISIKSFKKKDNLGFKLVLTFYLIFQTGILGYAFFLNGDVFEHYLATLLPYFFIMIAVVLVYLIKNKYLFYGILVLFVLLNMNLVFKAYNPFGFENKMEASKFALNTIGNEKFSLDTLSSCYRWDGFYYPFIFLGKHPEKSYQDSNYSWLYNYDVPVQHPKKIIVMVPKGTFENSKFYETYLRYQQWVVERKSFGGIEVLILDNSKGDFH